VCFKHVRADKAGRTRYKQRFNGHESGS
jgi:hypothetical protein